LEPLRNGTSGGVGGGSIFRRARTSQDEAQRGRPLTSPDRRSAGSQVRSGFRAAYGNVGINVQRRGDDVNAVVRFGNLPGTATRWYRDTNPRRYRYDALTGQYIAVRTGGHYYRHPRRDYYHQSYYAPRSYNWPYQSCYGYGYRWTDGRHGYSASWYGGLGYYGSGTRCLPRYYGYPSSWYGSSCWPYSRTYLGVSTSPVYIYDDDDISNTVIIQGNDGYGSYDGYDGYPTPVTSTGLYSGVYGGAGGYDYAGGYVDDGYDDAAYYEDDSYYDAQDAGEPLSDYELWMSDDLGETYPPDRDATQPEAGSVWRESPTYEGQLPTDPHGEVIPPEGIDPSQIVWDTEPPATYGQEPSSEYFASAAQVRGNLLAQGRQAFYEGRYEDARRHFVEDVLLGDQDGEGAMYYAMASFAAGDYALSGAAIRRAVMTADVHLNEPFDPRPLYGDAQQFDAQLLELRAYVAAMPGDADARLLLGYLHLGQGQTAEARSLFAGLVEASPQDIVLRALQASAGEPLHPGVSVLPNR
jgi:hypothetical protein